MNRVPSALHSRVALTETTTARYEVKKGLVNAQVCDRAHHGELEDRVPTKDSSYVEISE